MDLLDTGLFDAHGFRHLGFAGHPEGSPDIADPELADALVRKNAFAARTDASCELVTQFVFAAEPVIAWERRIRAAGNRLPVRVGLPGLATIKTLIGHARACGIGPSMQVLLRQARNIARLMSVSAPDALLLDLARHRLDDPDTLLHGVHVYPLGGLARSAAWVQAVAAGEIALQADGAGFEVTRPLD
jgi:methylenetetrahydrofolate reductase (NADPH)